MAPKNPSKLVTVFLNQHRSLSVPYQSKFDDSNLTEEEKKKAMLIRPTHWIQLIGGATTEINEDLWEIIKKHPAVEELFLMGLLYEIPTPDTDRLHNLDGQIIGGDIVKGVHEPQPLMPVRTGSTGMTRPQVPLNRTGDPRIPPNPIGSNSPAGISTYQQSITPA